MEASVAEHERLAALIGRWKTAGSTREMPGASAAEIEAVDTYEWLPGGLGLLHVVNGRVGDREVEGAEIIGYDADQGAYVTLSVGSDGSTAYEASLTQESEGLTWRMRSKTTRFAGVFNEAGDVINEAGDVITGHWELLQDGGVWEPWMDITLTKQGV